MTDPENKVEELKGRAKEAAGAATGKDDLKREGEAQQEKAEKREDARQKEAEAQEARAEALAADARAKKQ